jgi:AraC family transcriptional regulator
MMEIVIGVQRAIDFIEDNIFEDLTYEAISKQALMSSYHFQRLFAIVCGCSLGEYIRNRRLSLAGEEILSTNDNVIDIAFKYGYETPEGFTRAFTRFHGITPSMARSLRNELKSFTKISVQSKLKGEKDKMVDLSERGYVVKENGSVYFTRNMDETAKWFEKVLGWYVGIDERNEDGVGTYGCALPVPGELVTLQIAQFKGIHMFYGEPEKQRVAFMLIAGIDGLYKFVKKNGWEQITEITERPWGARECEVTTNDGSILTFFELC